MASFSALNFRDISQLTILIPVLIGFVRYSRLSAIQRLVIVIVLLSLLTEGIGRLIIEFSDQAPNNLPVYNIFAVVFFAVVNRIYIRSLTIVSRRFMNVWLVFFIGFALLNFAFFQPISTFASNTLVMGNVTYLVLGFLYFYQLLRLPRYHRLERDPMFWFSSGLLVYNSSALVIFLLIRYVITGSAALINTSLVLNGIFNILLNLFYASSLLCRPVVENGNIKKYPE